MENTEQTRSFSGFMKKYGFLFPIIFSLIGIVFLLSAAPVLEVFYKNETVDPALEWSEALNLYQILGTYQKNNWLFYALFVLVLIAIVTIFLRKLHKTIPSLSFGLFAASTVLAAMLPQFYAFNNIEFLDEVKQRWGLILCAVFLGLATLSQFINSYQEDKMSISDITEDGMLIAMAFVFNLIKLFPMPTGGSVNLQMLPLFLIALRHGPLHGFISAGIVYGLLTCLTDGYGLATYPFDYLIGFGSTAILGFFRPLIMVDKNTYNLKGELFLFVGGAIASFFRMVGGTLSSMVVYEYPFVEALMYNVGYTLVSGGIAIIVIMVLYGPLLRINNSINQRHSVTSNE